MISPFFRVIIGTLLFMVTIHGSVLDKQQQLDRFPFWENLDQPWFKERIPFFESPNSDIDIVYYYRWEMITKHLIYGSPEDGYTFTEFLTRVSWGGSYGAISCPVGHQLYEVRWLNDRRITDDFARYWHHVPGANPTNYSNWFGDGIYAMFMANGDREFLRQRLPDIEKQYEKWMKQRWDPVHQMFFWSGMKDGMENNISSRQTPNSFGGAEGYRPTLNSYIYGDLMALAQGWDLLGDTAKATKYRDKALKLKERIQQELWDPKRLFYVHQFKNDEKKDVVVNGTKTTFTIKAKTRIYDDGQFAGCGKGREEIGFVPWQFNLPDHNKGYEQAWLLLNSPKGFLAPYGPTSVERSDPLFLVDSKKCCFWSGNSWPFATSQTLTALANLLNNYRQSIMTKQDWFKVFNIYAHSQFDKDGNPNVHEQLDPDQGTWLGCSHYFHSSYTDLVITGLVGLRPRADDIIEINPLAPDDWSFFILDDVRYHDRLVTIIWDVDGKRYNRGKGLSIIADDHVIANTPRLERLSAPLPPITIAKIADVRHNVAVNNRKLPYPHVTCSSTTANSSAASIINGGYWYGNYYGGKYAQPERWVAAPGNTTDWVEINFGIDRHIEEIKLYLLDDGSQSSIKTPQSFDVEYWINDNWKPIPVQTRDSEKPQGHRPNSVRFPEISTSRIRAVFTHQPGGVSGLTEFEAWSRSTLPLPQPITDTKKKRD